MFGRFDGVEVGDDVFAGVLVERGGALVLGLRLRAADLDQERVASLQHVHDDALRPDELLRVRFVENDLRVTGADV